MDFLWSDGFLEREGIIIGTAKFSFWKNGRHTVTAWLHCLFHTPRVRDWPIHYARPWCNKSSHVNEAYLSSSLLRGLYLGVSGDALDLSDEITTLFFIALMSSRARGHFISRFVPIFGGKIRSTVWGKFWSLCITDHETFQIVDGKVREDNNEMEFWRNRIDQSTRN